MQERPFWQSRALSELRQRSPLLGVVVRLIEYKDPDYQENLKIIEQQLAVLMKEVEAKIGRENFATVVALWMENHDTQKIFSGVTEINRERRQFVLTMILAGFELGDYTRVLGVRQAFQDLYVFDGVDDDPQLEAQCYDRLLRTGVYLKQLPPGMDFDIIAMVDSAYGNL